MTEIVFEMPRDSDGRVVGYQAGRDYHRMEQAAYVEECKYQDLFRELEMRNAGLEPGPAPEHPTYYRHTTPLDARDCAECGGEFQPTHGSATICSDRCRRIRAGGSSLDRRECNHCGKSFTPHNGNARACSDRCRRKRVADTQLAWRWANRDPEAESRRNTAAYRRKNPISERACKRCRKMWLPKRTDALFCSAKCCAAFHHRFRGEKKQGFAAA